MPKPLITQERLKEMLSYDLETGVFRWKVKRGGVEIGSVAGSLNGHRYRYITVDGRNCRAHRLAWLFVHGVWPSKEIDHINGDKDDNRLENLREATRAENQRNVGMRSNNTTGFKGVYPYKDKYRALASHNGKLISLGYYATALLASDARIAFAKVNHREFYKPPA